MRRGLDLVEDWHLSAFVDDVEAVELFALSHFDHGQDLALTRQPDEAAARMLLHLLRSRLHDGGLISEIDDVGGIDGLDEIAVVSA